MIMLGSVNWSWAALLRRVAFHGVTSGMGGVFAGGLAMRRRRRPAVWRALLPLALGHALAIAVAIAFAILAGIVVPLRAMQWTVGGVLLTLGISRFFRHAHPRWVGMQV